MNSLKVVVGIDFSAEACTKFAKAWRSVRDLELEQALDLPPPVLAAGTRLELTLDGEVRELFIDALCWQHTEKTLRVIAAPTEATAGELRALGLGARLGGKRAAADFLERCRASGWRAVAREEPSPKPLAEPATPRREPTL
jgi:hypothetical protein